MESPFWGRSEASRGDKKERKRGYDPQRHQKRNTNNTVMCTNGEKKIRKAKNERESKYTEKEYRSIKKKGERTYLTLMKQGGKKEAHWQRRRKKSEPRKRP